MTERLTKRKKDRKNEIEEKGRKRLNIEGKQLQKK
jgi:hypothetical protein